MSTLAETNLPLPLYGRGKVRDTYDLGNALLIIGQFQSAMKIFRNKYSTRTLPQKWKTK